MNCPDCGQSVDDGAAFCQHCGASLQSAEQTSQVSEVAQLSAAAEPAPAPQHDSAEAPSEPSSHSEPADRPDRTDNTAQTDRSDQALEPAPAAPAPAPAAAASDFEIECISGPDKGKRVNLGVEAVVLGRSADAGVLSDDEDVAPEHVTLRLLGSSLSYQTHGRPVFVDGVKRDSGSLDAGRQLRVGRSTWQFQRESGRSAFKSGARSLFETISQTYIEAVDRETTKRTDEDVEAFFTVGTPTTTPAESEIEASWPKPWLFLKALTASVIMFVLFLVAALQFNNIIVLPGLMFAGAVAVPISILVLFFEFNVPKNISLYQVFKLFAIGGILSILISLVGFKLVDLGAWLGASAAGLIEETGKVLALLIVINKVRYKWTLNGLLLGGAVGAGFAVFESAGYAFMVLAAGGDISMMLNNIALRAILAPGGHVAWAALEGAVLWKIKGDRPFTWSLLSDPRFLRVFVFTVGLHMIWNSPWDPPYYFKYILLIALAWIAVMSFVADGINQVKKAQAAMQPSGS